MNSGFSPSGSINLTSLPASLKSQGSTGLQPLRVQSVDSHSGGYRITAQLGSSTVNFTADQAPPEGSFMLGRVQESGGNYKLDLLSTPQQLDQVKTRTLMNLLNSSGFNPAEGDASRLFSRLARQGYLTSADVSGSSAP